MSGGVFNIGSQQAGAIYQAGGDQAISNAGGTLVIAPLDAVADLRVALEAMAIPAESAEAVDRSLQEVEAELSAPAPDRSRVARRLEGMVDALGRAGALVSAGESLVAPLRSLASWAGVAGGAALRLLA